MRIDCAERVHIRKRACDWWERAGRAVLGQRAPRPDGAEQKVRSWACACKCNVNAETQNMSTRKHVALVVLMLPDAAMMPSRRHCARHDLRTCPAFSSVVYTAGYDRGPLLVSQLMLCGHGPSFCPSHVGPACLQRVAFSRPSISFSQAGPA